MVVQAGAGKKPAAISEANVDEQAEAEFLGEARDVVATLNLTLQGARNKTSSAADAVASVQREAAGLKMRAKTVNQATVNIIAHRLEDYTTAISELDEKALEDLQTFVDRLESYLDGDSEESQAVPEIVRELPSKRTFDVSEVTYTPVEMLLVMSKRTQARVVERELAACGYTCTTTLNPFEAFEQIVRTQPDMVLTTAVMPELGGIDLACALSAMPSTRHIPVALVTSLEPKRQELKDLPKGTGVIRRGQNFGEDLADVLQRFKIL